MMRCIIDKAQELIYNVGAQRFMILVHGLAGGHFHLRPMAQCLQPGQFDRDTRVEVVKV